MKVTFQAYGGEVHDLRAFDEVKAQVVVKAMDMLRAMAQDIKRLAKERLRANGSVITGRLINSIYVKTTGQNENPTYTSKEGSFTADFDVSLNDNEVAVGTNVPYASAVELGSRPHFIEVKNAKVLGNKEVGFFGRRVNHPGFVGKSYLYWAVKHLDIQKHIDNFKL